MQKFSLLSQFAGSLSLATPPYSDGLQVFWKLFSYYSTLVILTHWWQNKTIENLLNLFLFFNRLFWCTKANFGPLLSGQSHSTMCIISLNYSFTQNQEPLSKVGSISPAQQCQYVFASLKTSKNTADMKTTAFEIYSIVQKK